MLICVERLKVRRSYLKAGLSVCISVFWLCWLENLKGQAFFAFVKRRVSGYVLLKLIVYMLVSCG